MSFPVPTEGAAKDGAGPAAVLSPELAAIQARFIERIRDDRSFFLERREELLAAAPDPLARVHRLAGSAGMVGHQEISELAATLEDELRERKGEPGRTLDSLLDLLARTLAEVGRDC